MGETKKERKVRTFLGPVPSVTSLSLVEKEEIYGSFFICFCWHSSSWAAASLASSSSSWRFGTVIFMHHHASGAHHSLSLPPFIISLFSPRRKNTLTWQFLKVIDEAFFYTSLTSPSLVFSKRTDLYFTHKQSKTFFRSADPDDIL